MAAAFTTPARADGETIAVFTKNQTNPFFQTVRVGADNMAKQLNARVLQYIPTKPDSIPEQLSQIEDVVVKRPRRDRLHAGRLQGDGAGRARRSTRRKSPSSTSPTASAGGKIVTFVGADDYSLGLGDRAVPAQEDGRQGQHHHHRGRQGLADQAPIASAASTTR